MSTILNSNKIFVSGFTAAPYPIPGGPVASYPNAGGSAPYPTADGSTSSPYPAGPGIYPEAPGFIPPHGQTTGTLITFFLKLLFLYLLIVKEKICANLNHSI